ncbi:plasma protease C1 inhibitor isoform X2 [Rhinichthys klamathensis goyatoka]|uniref:plasma protease C1 inhibitor isoform X2 n=1 Tax=Rhinichthys klamathensis goyatoka TaxID=3034132 RepID=UPI0024B56E9E|nr:plasma protease C1 inhibitor isoform X2 [Rhinichthys klamathensis goyatoka]
MGLKLLPFESISATESNTMYRILLLLCAGLSLSTCDITVPLNSSISLPCLPDKAPTLVDSTYTWSVTSNQTQQQHILEEKSNILNFRSINTSDSGQYKCVQEGYKGEGRVRLSRTFTIRVEEPPPFQEWQVIKVEAMNDVTLPCQVNGFLSSRETKSPPVVWKREKEGVVVLLKPVKETDRQEERDLTLQRVFWNNRSDEQDWAIKISQAREEDAGMYQCVITESSHTLLVELEVQAPPPPRCLGHTDPWEACLDPNSRSGRAIVQESLREFATSVYSNLKGSKPKTNLIFSPVSIAAALYNLLLGARGETRKQLEDALKLPPKFSCLHSEIKNLKQVMKDTLGMASAIFYTPEQQLGEAFINQSLEFYDAMPQKLTNDSDLNVKLINEWVADKTNKKITELITEVDPSTSFVLLNAVYFNGKWKTVFESTNKPDKFTTFSDQAKDVPTLYSSKYSLQMGYFKNLKAEVGKFPLTGKNSLYILVPSTPSEKDFLLMENNINYKTIEEMVSKMNKMPIQTAEVTLPVIKLTEITPLEKLLRNLDLFLNPNLCGMFPGESESFISDVRHSASLSLTEKGVEAAAATSISFSRSSSSFSALQPFILVLWDDEAAIPLFMGRIIDP